MTNNKRFPWNSPLTAKAAAASQIVCRELQYSGGAHYLLERRPAEQGRSVFLQIQHGNVVELLPKSSSVRCRIHEYGGGSYLVGHSGIFYVEESDQQVYQLSADGSVHQLTHDNNSRFGNFCEHPRLRHLVCVRETREDREVRNEIVAVRLSDGSVTVLVSGDDFYSYPCLSTDGLELAYISWCHPHMPWQSNMLWRQKLSIELELIDQPELVSGDESSKSQPHWSSDGRLYYLDDCSGWWNIWSQKARGLPREPVTPIEADLGRAQWELGTRSYHIFSDGKIYALASKRGIEHLMLLESGSCSWRKIALPHTELACLNESDDGQCSLLATGPRSTSEVLQVGSQSARSLLPARKLAIQDEYISSGESIAFTARDGSQAQGFFYAPVNPQAIIETMPPPLVVIMHGGPTSACSNSFKSIVQFWTSRGMAVFDVNYRGSTGFGRKYRLALQDSWGVADVQDCADGVEHLVKQGLVDGRRVVIRGGSAGGFTALAAAVCTDVFAAVGCHYGIGNLELLAGDTHKFESHYLEHLVGAYPKYKTRYIDRSPVHHLEKIKCPVFVSHGLLDQVVPVNQAQQLAVALTENGVEVEVLLFEDERHGYTQEKNIAKLLQQEFDFYRKAFEHSEN